MPFLGALSALVVVPAAQAEAFLKSVEEFEGIVKNELATEPDLSVQVVRAGDGAPAKVMEEEAQRTLINALDQRPGGDAHE